MNDFAVKDLNLECEQGEFVAFLGPSGCGKTTTLRMIAGLEDITDGDIYIGDRRVNDLHPKDRHIGLAFEDYAMYPPLTVYDNVAFNLRAKGVDKAEIDRRVRESARMVGLAEELLEKSPFDLSGGQKRRVAIAGVMAMEPKVLILDEPTAGLDPRGRDEILAQIRAYHETKRATVILVSHSMEEIARNVERIVVMRDAHVYMDGTPRQVFARAEELEQAGLDVPQVTKIAMALRRRGMDIDPAVYTIEELEQALLARRGGGEGC